MPTFDFQCTKCSSTFEFNRPFGSEKTPPCPECGSIDVNKLISTPNIQFKGEGFYKTDSQKKPKTKKKDKTTEPSAKDTNSGQAPEKPPKEQKDSKKDAK